jgi:uncharacterized membrane protein (Fun14 family)
MASSLLLQRSLRSTLLNRNTSVVLGLSSLTFSTATTTFCAPSDEMIKKKRDGSVDWEATQDAVATTIGQKIQTAVDTGIPTQLSYGFVCGYCSGYALKKIGRIGAIVGGLGFMTLQTLSYSGYITIDHDRMKKEVENWMDLNKDGKVDADDSKLAINKVLRVLEYNMPGGGGFAAGFIGGIRSG